MEVGRGKEEGREGRGGSKGTLSVLRKATRNPGQRDWFLYFPKVDMLSFPSTFGRIKLRFVCIASHTKVLT